MESNITVHLATNLTSSLTLVLAYMRSSEQKLSVQITNFDVVIISDCEFTITFC